MLTNLQESLIHEIQLFPKFHNIYVGTLMKDGCLEYIPIFYFLFTYINM